MVVYNGIFCNGITNISGIISDRLGYYWDLNMGYNGTYRLIGLDWDFVIHHWDMN